jgi:hypothetical protein
MTMTYNNIISEEKQERLEVLEREKEVISKLNDLTEMKERIQRDKDLNNEEVAITDEEVMAGLVAQNQADFGQSGEEIIAAAKEPFDAKDNDAVNEAANMFSRSIPRIKGLARNLGGGALYRVFSAVMEFPLQDKEPKFRSDAEMELFQLCLAATMAKSTMMQAMMAERAREERAKALAQQAITPVESILNETNMTKAATTVAEGVVSE